MNAIQKRTLTVHTLAVPHKLPPSPRRPVNQNCCGRLTVVAVLFVQHHTWSASQFGIHPASFQTAVCVSSFALRGSLHCGEK